MNNLTVQQFITIIERKTNFKLISDKTQNIIKNVYYVAKKTKDEKHLKILTNIINKEFYCIEMPSKKSKNIMITCPNIPLKTTSYLHTIASFAKNSVMANMAWEVLEKEYVPELTK